MVSPAFIKIRINEQFTNCVTEKAKVPYSFIAELRDRGDNGFLLPRQQIIPTAEETWEGVKLIANEVRADY